MEMWQCTVCGYIHKGEEAPEVCPQCKAPKEKFVEYVDKGLDLVDGNVLGVAKGSGLEDELRAQFEGECTEIGMFVAMSRQAEREGFAEIAETYKRIAFEEAGHAARFAELLGEVFSKSTKENLEARVAAEVGACKGKKELATRAKKEGHDEIHDFVHEACRDEARHASSFNGLLKRYFA